MQAAATVAEMAAAEDVVRVNPGRTAQSIYPTVNLGPLTTTFTAPSSCSSYTMAYRGHVRGQTMVYQFDYGKTCGFDDRRVVDAACLPPRYAAAYNNMDGATNEENVVYPVFSPASICPVGYSSACGFAGPTTTGTASAGAETAPITGDRFGFTMSRVLASGQIGVGCCRSGYVCDERQVYHCTSNIPIDSIITADMNSACKSHTEEIGFLIHVSSGANVYADGACVMLVRNAEQTTSYSQASPTTAIDGAATSGPGTSSGSGEADTPMNEGGGLSRGAKIAVGVTVPAVVFSAGIILCGVLKRYRRRARKARATDPEGTVEASNTAPGQEEYTGKAEMDATDHRQSSIMSPVSARVASTISDGSTAVFHEARQSRALSELQGSYPAHGRLHEDIVELAAEGEGPAARPRPN